MEVTIGFRGTEEYRKRLQQEALNRGLKVQQLLEAAVELYVNRPNSKHEGDRISPDSKDVESTLEQMEQALEKLRSQVRYLGSPKGEGSTDSKDSGNKPTPPKPFPSNPKTPRKDAPKRTGTD